MCICMYLGTLNYVGQIRSVYIIEGVWIFDDEVFSGYTENFINSATGSPEFGCCVNIAVLG